MARWNTCSACVSVASLCVLGASKPAAGQASAAPEPPVLCAQGSNCSTGTVGDSGGTPGDVLVAVTFENQPTGVLDDDNGATRWTADIGDQEYFAHYNGGGDITIVNGTSCRGTNKFARSKLEAGNESRAELNFNDEGGDLRSGETGWTADRPNWWFGFCVRLDPSFPYPYQDGVTVWQTHTKGWRPEESDFCSSPVIGLGIKNQSWKLSEKCPSPQHPEYDQPSQNQFIKDYSADVGNWVQIVFHWIAGDENTGEWHVWMDGVKVFEDVDINTFDDSMVYYAYELPVGLYNASCKNTPCVEQIVDYDELRWADGTGLSDEDGFATVSPSSY